MLVVTLFILSLSKVHLHVRAAPLNSPTTLQSYNGWTSVGCFVDSIFNRQIPHSEATQGGPDAMTVEVCLDACRNDGYSVAGLEWSQECYCGDSIPPQEATDGRCDMACKGDANEICGGGNGLSVYQLQANVVPSYKSWTYVNCYEDSVDDRTIPNAEWVSGPMTVEACLDACTADGYTVAGLEWSQECYCGYSLPPQVATDGRCNMACKGDLGEMCGGGNGLTVYESRCHDPHHLDYYKSWTYDNCYVDSRWDRVLPECESVDGLMTIEKCLDACDHAGYEYGGVEYGKECWCGRQAPTEVATDGRCNMPCEGNKWEDCGGGNGIDVYHSCDPRHSPHDISYHNGWNFEGCFVDSIQNRVLPVKACEGQDDEMTIERCLDECYNIGYDYAGLEYAQECWCGSSMPPQPATDGRCNMVCTGDNHEYCGGGNGLDVYSYSPGPPGHTIKHHDKCPPRSTTFTTTYATTTAVETTITLTSTIIEPTTGVTTVTVPIAGTATIPETLGVPTTVTETETELTTVTLPVTGSTTIYSPVTLTTTIPVAVTGTSTIAVPYTASTTVTEITTTDTILTIPTTESVLTTIPTIATVTPTTTFISISRTLSIFTGTTSFVDSLTTIYEPIIILTTLSHTLTITGLGSPTGVPSSIVTDEPFPTVTISTEVVTTTLYDVDPVPTSSIIYTPITTTSFDIETTTSTSTDIEPVTTDTIITSTYTETLSVTTTVSVPTETLSDYTTDSFETAPDLGSFITTSTTTLTTTFEETITGTTTVTTAATPSRY